MTAQDAHGQELGRTITITGARSIGDLPTAAVEELIGGYLRPFAADDTLFFVGGAIGVDTLALLWLAEHTASRITVVVPRRLEDQPPEAVEAIRAVEQRGRLTEVVELEASALSRAAYHARNRWMVNRSDLVIGFPRGADRASGSWYTLDQALGLRKPHLIVPL